MSDATLNAPTQTSRALFSVIHQTLRTGSVQRGGPRLDAHGTHIVFTAKVWVLVTSTGADMLRSACRDVPYLMILNS